MGMSDNIKALVKSLFDDHLDVVEYNEYGDREFHPIIISCGKISHLISLGELIEKLRKLSHE